jgi:hypothetical protein
MLMSVKRLLKENYDRDAEQLKDGNDRMLDMEMEMLKVAEEVLRWVFYHFS